MFRSFEQSFPTALRLRLRHRWRLFAGAALAACATQAFAVPPTTITSTTSGNTVTVSATGFGPGSWTVPAGVTSVQIVAIGGGGGGGNSLGGAANTNGGHGGKVTVTLSVTPGQVLNLRVGEGGGISAHEGGGGGGSTNVNEGTANQIIAGGGGGGGTGSGAFIGGSGGNGNGSSAPNVPNAGGGGGGSGGVGGSAGLPGGGVVSTAGSGGGSGSGGMGGSGWNAPGGRSAGSGTGGGGQSTYQGGGGGGYGGGGSGGNGSPDAFNTVGGGGGGGGSVGPAGAVIGVGANRGVSGAAGGDGSITITYTQPEAPALVSALGSLPAVPGVRMLPNVLDLSSGSGPSMVSCLINTIRQLLGEDASYLGQTPYGVARISTGSRIISFYPLSASSAVGNGITLGASNTMTVATSCGSFVVAPALQALTEFGANMVVRGITAQINADGVIHATIDGTLHAVRPDYFSTPATHTAGLRFATDGALQFTDSAGVRQTLYPAFLDTTSLQNAAAGAWGGNTIIQIDGTAVFTRINGQQTLLSPEMTLASANSLSAPAWVADREKHYLYRTGASYQGMGAQAR